MRNIDDRPDTAAPTRTYRAFKPYRQPSEWIEDGQIVTGHEASGLALPYRVIDSLGRPGPSEYLVMGEARYSDGRWFLDFGMNPVYIEHTTEYRFIPGRADNPVYVCPDCDGVSGEHQKIMIPDPDAAGKPLMVKCPRDTRRAFGRGS